MPKLGVSALKLVRRHHRHGFDVAAQLEVFELVSLLVSIQGSEHGLLLLLPVGALGFNEFHQQPLLIGTGRRHRPGGPLV